MINDGRENGRTVLSAGGSSNVNPLHMQPWQHTGVQVSLLGGHLQAPNRRHERPRVIEFMYFGGCNSRKKEKKIYLAMSKRTIKGFGSTDFAQVVL
jgi:hypothetical protein